MWRNDETRALCLTQWEASSTSEPYTVDVRQIITSLPEPDEG